MATTRSVLGHVSVETAQRQRKCHRDPKRHEILRNDVCIVVSNGRFERKNYCRACANGILEKAKTDLEQLFGAMKAPNTG
jgi:hypothetical protein